MVVLFCKSGVIRPGTCALWCILYFTKVAKDISSPICFPFLYLYSFPRGFMHADQNILVFPELFEGSQRDPTVWGEREPLSRGCRQSVPLGWICLHGHSQDVLGWVRDGVCLAISWWDKDTEWCWISSSPSRRSRDWRKLGSSPLQAPVHTLISVCTEMGRSQPELAASASHNDHSWTFMQTFVLNK